MYQPAQQTSAEPQLATTNLHPEELVMLLALLESEELQGLVPVSTPMPNKHALTIESERLNAEKHKAYRSMVGSMQCFATQTTSNIIIIT